MKDGMNTLGRRRMHAKMVIILCCCLLTIGGMVAGVLATRHSLSTHAAGLGRSLALDVSSGPQSPNCRDEVEVDFVDGTLQCYTVSYGGVFSPDRQFPGSVVQTIYAGNNYIEIDTSNGLFQAFCGPGENTGNLSFNPGQGDSIDKIVSQGNGIVFTDDCSVPGT